MSVSAKAACTAFEKSSTGIKKHVESKIKAQQMPYLQHSLSLDDLLKSREVYANPWPACGPKGCGDFDPPSPDCPKTQKIA